MSVPFCYLFAKIIAVSHDSLRRSYCKKHSSRRKDSDEEDEQNEEEKRSQRHRRIMELEEEFYTQVKASVRF